MAEVPADKNRHDQDSLLPKKPHRIRWGRNTLEAGFVRVRLRNDATSTSGWLLCCCG